MIQVTKLCRYLLFSSFPSRLGCFRTCEKKAASTPARGAAERALIRIRIVRSLLGKTLTHPLYTSAVNRGHSIKDEWYGPLPFLSPHCYTMI